MINKKSLNKDKFILAIHSTYDYFGFAYQELSNKNAKNSFYIKKLDLDLSRNLITHLAEFLDRKKVRNIERVSISIGPANFNASRQIVVCARALAQQINCSLDKYNCFQLMAKRIAIKQEIIKLNKEFWIFKKLKRRGYIAGKYFIKNNDYHNSDLQIDEMISPNLYKDLLNKQFIYEAEYDIKSELKELLYLSTINYKKSIINNWEQVLPIYPIDAVN